MDTVRGFDGQNAYRLSSNNSNGQSASNVLRCYNSDGFTLQDGDFNQNNN